MMLAILGPWMAWMITRGRQIVGGTPGVSIVIAGAIAGVVLLGGAWFWSDVKSEVREAARAECLGTLERARAEQAEVRVRALEEAITERDRALKHRDEQLRASSTALATLELEQERLRHEAATRDGNDLVGVDPGWLRGSKGAAPP